MTYEWEGVPAGSVRAHRGMRVRPDARCARGLAGPARREGDLHTARHRRRAAFAAIDDADDAPAARGRDRPPRGAEDAARRLRRQGPSARARRRRSTRAAWLALGGVPLDPRAGGAVRPGALDRRRTRARRIDRVLAARREPARARHPADDPRARAGARRRHCRTTGKRSRCASSTTSTTSECSRSSCSSTTASSSRTRSRHACHNSGHWTIEGADTSQFENHLRAVLGWPLGSTPAHGRARDGQLHRHAAGPCRGARGPGRAPARLRQGAPRGPQGRPRHRRRARRRHPRGAARPRRGARSATTARRSRPTSRSLPISSALKPHSASTSSVCSPGLGRVRAHLGLRAREAGRRRGLEHTLVLDHGPASLDVRVFRGLGHREHGREARVASLEDLAPLVTRLGREQLREPLAQAGPTLASICSGRSSPSRPVRRRSSA